MSVDATLFCFDFKERRVDLQFKYVPSCVGNFVVESSSS